MGICPNREILNRPEIVCVSDIHSTTQCLTGPVWNRLAPPSSLPTMVYKRASSWSFNILNSHLRVAELWGSSCPPQPALQPPTCPRSEPQGTTWYSWRLSSSPPRSSVECPTTPVLTHPSTRSSSCNRPWHMCMAVLPPPAVSNSYGPTTSFCLRFPALSA